MENKLIMLQSELKAPKNQYNKFGNYYYRSCEDILEAVKPLLLKYNATLLISDEIIMIGNRYYVKATAKLIIDDKEYISQAYAREEEVKKGMDASQITGASSSYARKYALNGLFLIDDNKDSDYTNNHENNINTKKYYQSQANDEKTIDDKIKELAKKIMNTQYKVMEISNTESVNIQLKHKGDKTFALLNIGDDNTNYYIFDSFVYENILKCKKNKEKLYLYITDDKKYSNIIFGGNEELHNKLKENITLPF